MAGQNEYEKWIVLVKDLFAQTSEEVPLSEIAKYMTERKGKYGIVK
jgi:hypothetical protein